MCGRYTLLTPAQELEIRAIVKEAEERLKQRKTENVKAHMPETDVYPEMMSVILKPDNNRFSSFPAFWGMTGWRKKAKRQPKDGTVKWNKPTILSNTKDTTATTKHPVNEWEVMLVECLKERRCIIPTTGFYEIQYSYDKKPGDRPTEPGVPFYFYLPNGEITYTAGIWRSEANGNGETWDHYSMMTTEANTFIEKVHGRMLVVLRESELLEWLYGDYEKLLDRRKVKIEGKVA